ncbi:hypothetical protein BDF21DRAFT_317576, partial [Thamnidium elegans]
ARKTKSPLVAVLLDQEKAYDRIHPEYIGRVLSPPGLVSTLDKLFFGTKINI